MTTSTETANAKDAIELLKSKRVYGRVVKNPTNRVGRFADTISLTIQERDRIIRALEQSSSATQMAELVNELKNQYARTNFEVEHGRWDIATMRFYEGERGAYKFILDRIASEERPRSEKA